MLDQALKAPNLPCRRNCLLVPRSTQYCHQGLLLMWGWNQALCLRTSGLSSKPKNSQRWRLVTRGLMLSTKADQILMILLITIAVHQLPSKWIVGIGIKFGLTLGNDLWWMMVLVWQGTGCWLASYKVI